MQIKGSREIYDANAEHDVSRWSITPLLTAAKPSRYVKRKTQLQVTLTTENICQKNTKEKI